MQGERGREVREQRFGDDGTAPRCWEDFATSVTERADRCLTVRIGLDRPRISRVGRDSLQARL
jgi:hypothetical protein